MKYGYGCKPSKMDGTEHKYEYTKAQLPLTYNYVSVMPPVTDQGSSSKCVCHALTAYLDWNKNQFGKNQGIRLSRVRDCSSASDSHERTMPIGIACKV